MIRRIGASIGRALIAIVLTVTFVFIVLRVSGDPVEMLLSSDATPEMMARIRAEWGLDQPLYIQYFTYVQHILQGDFGRSLSDGRPALTVILEKAPATLELMGVGLLIGLVLGVVMGLFAATHRGSAIDRIVMGTAVLVHAMPSFLLCILAILLFAVRLRWLPSGGGSSPLHLILPSLVIGLAAAGVIARFVRSSALEVIGQQYIRAASIKPLPRWYFFGFHILPNAALPLLTLIGFLVGGMIGGAAVVESVFAWPGIGRFLVTVVAKRDLAVVQTIVILISLTMVLANLGADILYTMVDPRLRDRREG
ncbi:MAG TPA: ABC transporter permease [Devosiaceae bacterium]|jgi:peptide/nickel transport system permease protein